MYDIENAYLIGGAWEIFEANIIEVFQPPYILCVAYKWLGEKKTHFISIPDFHGNNPKGRWGYKPEQEKEVITAFHKVMDEADFLCGHNADNFDFKKLNTAFLKYGLPPTKPTKMIDTLKAARKIAKFPSNKLDELGHTLGVGRKLPHTGKHLWTSCMKGDPASWKMMKAYNIQDVLLLERVYLKLRPYITNHPDISVVTHSRVCRSCGSKNLQKRGWHFTKSKKTQRLQCKDCFSWNLGESEKLSPSITTESDTP